MKTHHWAGVTLSLKNFFGVMPGIVYGWPKNVLHHAGIGPSILDIAAAVRPHLAIVDGIIGMEGDGPIMGTPRQAGVLVMGTNLPAVDATCARLMQIDPWKIGYLAAASGRLGPIAERHIEQRGETIKSFTQRFELLDHPSSRRPLRDLSLRLGHDTMSAPQRSRAFSVKVTSRGSWISLGNALASSRCWSSIALPDAGASD